MTDIAVGTRPKPQPQPPLDEGPVEKLVSLSSRAVADGFDGKLARVCMLMRPWVGSDPASVDISAWPSAVSKNIKLHEGRIGLRVIPIPSDLETRDKAEAKIRELAVLEGHDISFRPQASPAWPEAADKDKQRIDRLWRRMMNPEGSGSGFWDLLAKTLVCAPAPEMCSAYLPTPHGAASLVFTLQRGRALLESLASADSPLAARGDGTTELSLARPWYQIDRPTQLASLTPDLPASISDPTSPENEEFWLAPYRRRTEALLDGRTPEPIWPDARTLAKTILAGDLPAAHAMECVHAAHHLTTPNGLSTLYCASPEDKLATAQRRLGALLNLPTLQRLFGFALDLLIDTEDMNRKLVELNKKLNGGTPISNFVALAPAQPGASWTLARFQPAQSDALFCPASWDEVLGKPENASLTFGMRNLARLDDQKNPVYDIITIDPALASESSINNRAAQKASREKGSALAPVERGQPVLHNGGLRVIEVKDQSAGAAKPAPSCPSGDIIEDADHLKIGDRLMVGIEVKDGEVLWRSPDYRVIDFLDPKPEAKSETGWIEAELSRRQLKANGARRIQLDGAMAMSARQKIVDALPEPSKTSDDLVVKQAIKIIEDSTVALWGSDPAGVPPAEYDQEKRKAITKRTLPVIEELDITRHFSSPSLPHHDKHLLSPALRFGWFYYTALVPVFEGGGSKLPDEVARISRLKPTVSLPPIPKDRSKELRGRRFLRHERVNAPMALLLDHDVAKLNALTPPQRGADMYVRTMKDGKHGLASTCRLIAPPPVPLQFAMLHDVLRHSGKDVTTPKQGLAGLSLLGAKDNPKEQKPNRASVGETQSKDRYVYYPDPAASVMVFGLKLPAEAGLENAPFVEDPVAVPVGARTWPDKSVGDKLAPWPNVVPIHLELKAVESNLAGRPRIESAGRRWLTVKGELASKPRAGAVEVQLVQVSLARGETLTLQAWCAPTAAQLADWFDAIESAGLLLLADNKRKGDPHAACIANLKTLLNKEPGADSKHSEEAATFACLGAGGLTAPPRKTVQMIAGLAYRELLLKPSSVLASPLTMRVTHAVDDSLMTVPTLGPNIAITRRIFASRDAATASDPAQSKPAAGVVAETPSDFLNNTPISDWGLNSTQQGATDVLVGGEIRFDPAGTGALSIEALCAAPFDETLDNPTMGLTRAQQLSGNFVPIDPNGKTDEEKAKPFGFIVDSEGKVSFPRKQVTLLKLDGLPLPKDGRSGLQPYSLQALMAAAWGDAREFGQALRAALPSALHCSGARCLSVTVLPVNRNAGLLPDRKPDQKNDSPRSTSRNVWLPATTRPAPPAIDHVSVALSHKRIKPLINTDGSFTVGVEQACVLTIWHARPFFSSGEGERLALVLWPPGLFARGSKKDDKGQELFPPEKGEPETKIDFYDEDLGPGGPYVTRWGADPLTADEVPQARFPTGPLIEPSRLSSDGERIPHAFMPVPISNQPLAPSDQSDNKQPSQANDPKRATDDQTPVAYMAVALQAFEPRFDPIQELWYINVALNTDPLPFPRVRLGLVRYQAHAREDDIPPEGLEPVRLRVSTPVKEWVKPLPGRRATVTCRPTSNERIDITVVIDGPSTNPEPKQEIANPRLVEIARPQMVVEVIRHKTIDSIAQEEIVKDVNGNSAICDEWTSASAAIEEDRKPNGIFIHSEEPDGGYYWSSMFTLRGPLEQNGWSTSVVVRETRRLERARSAEGPPQLADTGPVFLARIPLKME
jgi:hypothetical protein